MKLRKVNPKGKMKLRRRDKPTMADCHKCGRNMPCVFHFLTEDEQLLYWCSDCADKHYWPAFKERILLHRAERIKAIAIREAKARKRFKREAVDTMVSLLEKDATMVQIYREFKVLYAEQGKTDPKWIKKRMRRFLRLAEAQVAFEEGED